MPSVTISNVKINYVEQGAGDEALVFVHGISGSRVKMTHGHLLANLKPIPYSPHYLNCPPVSNCHTLSEL